MKTLFKVIVGALCITSIVAAIAYISIEETEKYSEIEDDGNRLGPGTTATYSYESSAGDEEISGTATYSILGINPGGKLYKLSYDLQDSEGDYPVDDRIRLTNDESVETTSTGTGGVKTIFGNLRSPYVEYYSSGTLYRDYYNPYNGLLYKTESQDTTVELISLDANWYSESSYEFSSVLGQRYNYELTGTVDGNEVSGDYTETIVAEGSSGTYWYRQTFTYESYTQTTYGLVQESSSDMTYDRNESIETVDGEKDLSVMVKNEDSRVTEYYVDETSLIIYRIDITDDTSEFVINYQYKDTDQTILA